MKFPIALVIVVAAFISSGSLLAREEKKQQILQVQSKQAVAVQEEDAPEQQSENSDEVNESGENADTDFYGTPPGGSGDSLPTPGDPYDDPYFEPGAIAIPAPVPDPKIPDDPLGRP
jgi:hypothetical protein